MLTINLNFLCQWKIRNESKPGTNMGDSIHNFRSICTRFLLKIKNDNMSKNEMILYYSLCMICAKHLSFVPIYSLIPPLFIDVVVPSHHNKQ